MMNIIRKYDMNSAFYQINIQNLTNFNVKIANATTQIPMYFPGRDSHADATTFAEKLK